jgi:hypothetical protein
MMRVAVLPLVLALACGPAPAAPGTGNVRVLLVGNSLTYFNDLPSMVQGLAASAGLDWDVHSVTLGGASLDDHFDSGTAVQLLDRGHWDVVVFQQGPSTLPESRLNLRQGVARFRPLVERAGGRVAMYEVWPDSAWSAGRFLADFDRVRDSYALAARDVNGLFLPAGEAWRAAWAAGQDPPLYGPDAFHPSPEGSYLAALTIVTAISGRPAAGLSRRLVTRSGQVLVDLPPTTALRLQQAADRAVRDYRDYQPVDRP